MSVEIIDTLVPKNNGDFPVVEAKDVAVNEQRLPEVLNNKADKSSTYTKQEVDTKIANVKVDAYTKAETDDKLNVKADKSTVDSLSQAITNKADKQVVSQLEGKMNSLGLTVENGMLCVAYGG